MRWRRFYGLEFAPDFGAVNRQDGRGSAHPGPVHPGQAPAQPKPSLNPTQTGQSGQSGPNPAQIQPKSSPNPAQIQPKSSPNPAQIQPKSGPNPAQIQSKSSPNPAQIRPKSGPNRPKPVSSPSDFAACSSALVCAMNRALPCPFCKTATASRVFQNLFRVRPGLPGWRCRAAAKRPASAGKTHNAP